ncbi:hypothetical protein Dimus_034147 [Dionaea muscipula]
MKMVQSIVEGSVSNMEIDIDRISNLPWDIQDMILGKLPLCDAVRTSVLSRGWRYKWLGVSSLVVDSTGILDSLEADKQTKGDALTRMVNYFLLNHQGNLRRFCIKTHCVRNMSGVYNWLQFISRRGVQEFVLEELDYVLFEVPSYLFMFKHLRSLELIRCVIQVPANFRGFNFLIELSLKRMTIKNEEIERLILICPAIERLTLLSLYDVDSLRIRGAALKSLFIDSGYTEVVIQHAPQLSAVNIAHASHHQNQRAAPNWHHLIHCLSSLPSLEQLCLAWDFFELWAKADVVEHFPFANDHLSTLVLDEMRFDSADALRVCCSLLQSCPNVHTLSFSVKTRCSRAVAGFFLEEDQQQNISFRHLKKVTLKYGNQMGAALDFLSFIVCRSPSLESATFVKEGDSPISQRTLERIYRQLKRSAPNSNAVVKFVAKVEPCDAPSSSRKRRLFYDAAA